jgi:tetratricopeptide (TPR) repeat protein
LTALLSAAPTPKERSYALFVEAEKAYQSGEVERAVTLLTQAWEASPEPVLLFNLARAHETLGHVSEALTAYRRYLLAEPTARDRRAIEARIAALDEQLSASRRERDERERLARALALKPAAPSRAWVGWLVAGAGAVGLLTGAVLKGVAFRVRDEADAEPVHQTAYELFGRAQGFDTASGATFAISGAVLGVGIALWALLDRTAAPPVLTLSAGPNRASLSIQW